MGDLWLIPNGATLRCTNDILIAIGETIRKTSYMSKLVHEVNQNMKADKNALQSKEDQVAKRSYCPWMIAENKKRL
ncbi:hypothetical protein CXB51_031445 [Gossypium anomalum]|uniref:Uncharacterized protein n=1 Tax=Gossypium anomalum TaxID=47600 RepID=A0A8J6CNR9_9ROSI|nr:hypothetical protein CXB51_031445 [Gossypium anomalum]